jgi:hypothetical protein
MFKRRSKATQLVVNLPFGIGQLQLSPEESEEKAAWELYVEFTTRIAVQPHYQESDLIREALSSLYSLFSATRQVLRSAGPSIAKTPKSLGPIAIEVLNKGIRPFLSKWHPLLLSHECKKSSTDSPKEYERSWIHYEQFWKELTQLNEDMISFAKSLAIIAGINPPKNK